MEIKRSGFQPSAKGPEAYFTGTVRVDAPFSGSGSLSATTVTFEPGARTAWHTHPLGQTLLVVSGLGRVQREGGPIEECDRKRRFRRRHRLAVRAPAGYADRRAERSAGDDAG